MFPRIQISGACIKFATSATAFSCPFFARLSKKKEKWQRLQSWQLWLSCQTWGRFNRLNLVIKAKKSIGLCAVEQRKRRINEKKTFNSKQGNKSGPFEQWPRAVQIIIVIAVNNLRYRGKKKQNENVEYSCLQFPLLFNCLVHTALLHSSARLQPTFINVRCASFTVAAIFFFFGCQWSAPTIHRVLTGVESGWLIVLSVWCCVIWF